MEQTNRCNNKDDELLAEEVQKHHCLYDERSEGYKEKDQDESRGTWLSRR